MCLLKNNFGWMWKYYKIIKFMLTMLIKNSATNFQSRSKWRKIACGKKDNQIQRNIFGAYNEKRRIEK